MDIKDKTILILGGWGLVGKAISRKLIPENPKRVIITSLKKEEALEELDYLRKTYPDKPADYFEARWGNVLLRKEFKDEDRTALLKDPVKRKRMIQDVMEELDDDILQNAFLYDLLREFKPDILIDCINTATGIAYQNIFSAYKSMTKVMYGDFTREELVEEAEKLLAVIYIPQLIRHIQILYNAMHDFDTKLYLKIGTSGTGGMGLNIPYTHSEEKPSRVLLSKSAVAGAHTLLLFLMARTPYTAITKEIKPAAAIAWKKIAFDTIKKGGKEILINDVPFDAVIPLKGKLKAEIENKFREGEPLKSVFIDTGENGIFSRGEFEAITAQKQMEFVTPEEIAADAVFEIKGGNTGHDVINALDNANTHPTYRAGYMQHLAVEKLKALERYHNTDSIAFEMLGPPRLSKLLFEIYFLKRLYGTMKDIVKVDPVKMSRDMKNLLRTNDSLRNQALSIGIPVLIEDGKTLLRGNVMKIPPFGMEKELEINDENIDKWAHAGWIDLRVENMELWLSRLNDIMDEANAIPEEDTSSLHVRTKQYWNYFNEIDIGRVVSWIFIHEEKGPRMKD